MTAFLDAIPFPLRLIAALVFTAVFLWVAIGTVNEAGRHQ